MFCISDCGQTPGLAQSTPACNRTTPNRTHRRSKSQRIMLPNIGIHVKSVGTVQCMKQTVTQLIDDIDGGKADETVSLLWTERPTKSTSARETPPNSAACCRTTPRMHALFAMGSMAAGFSYHAATGGRTRGTTSLAPMTPWTVTSAAAVRTRVHCRIV